MSVKVTFVPLDVSYDVEEKTKLLAVALKHKVKIQYGCASCRCGTCGVAIRGGSLSPMRENERQLLARMKLPLDGSIRLACQARVESEDVLVDLDFQGTYSPDQGDEDF